MAVSSSQLVYQRSATGLLSSVQQPCITSQFQSIPKQITFNCRVFRTCPFYMREDNRHRSRLVVAAVIDSPDTSYEDLKAGSPIMIIEAPPHLKTAEPMPMLRANKGAVMPGDAGRILSRKPKDVWAIRFKTGAFLIERRYFKPLDVE